MTVIYSDTDIEPWELPHMNNRANDAPEALNRRIAERVNELGTWEALQLRTADWCVTHPLLTAAIAAVVFVASAAASALFPFPWGMK